MNMHADGEQITAIDTRERILLTGATGFLGGSVAAQLIAAGHGANLSFLVRAESRQQGLERLRGNLLTWHCGRSRSSAAISSTPPGWPARRRA